MADSRITFGSQISATDALRLREIMDAARRSAFVNNMTADPLDAPHACGCVGPQPGETKCPCQLRAESRQGLRMVRDGIVVNGVEYDLVPRRK